MTSLSKSSIVPLSNLPVKKTQDKILKRFKDLAKDDIELDYLVDGLLPDAGWTLLVGDSGVGKSTFAAQLCAALQIGKPFLSFETVQKNCLYFQADSSLIIWREQIRRIAAESDAWSLHGIPNEALDVSEYIEIIEQIIKYVEPEFIVFDSLNSLTTRDINGKAIMGIIFLLEKLCSYKGEMIPFTLIHHPSKGDNKGVNKASGYHALSNKCDTYIDLNLHRLKVEKSRVVKNKIIPLRKDRYGLWQLDAQEAIELPEEFDIPL